jgi:hypothetical protein
MNRNVVSLIAATLITAGALHADILKFKSGGAVQGTLVSANSREVVFLLMDGAHKTYPVKGVDSITFAPLPPPPPPPPPPAPPAAASVVVPAGTQLAVRMIDSIAGQATASSQRYRASIDDPVVVGDRVVIPRGANCTVQVVNVEQSQELSLKLYDITLNGHTYATASDYAVVQAEGTSKKKKAVRRGVGLGAAGALIGAAAGGGQGAAIGAVVGGGVGAASAAAAKGKQLNVPSETRLSFVLRTALPIQ